jgi:hypothetical protein
MTLTRETMIKALEAQYARRLHRWMDATTDEERAGHKQLLDRIDEIIRELAGQPTDPSAGTGEARSTP